MSETITRDDGTTVEVYTIQELEQQKLEAEQKVRAEEKEKLNSVVEEVKDLRTKLQEAKAKIDNSGGNDVENTVKSLLEKERKSEIEANKEKARQIFFDKNKEFHPDNDAAGLKFSKVQKELSELREDGKVSVDDFLLLLSKAKKLATDKEITPDRVPVDASTPISNSSPESNSGSKLTAKEQELIKQVGWTEERYITLKAKQPDYVRNLLK